MQLKKLVLAGGTGFLGQSIVRHFSSSVEEIIVLSRSAGKSEGNVRYVQWDGKSKGSWENALENADVLINLTGKSVDCRYTEKNKREILRSRVDATKVLGEAVSSLKSPPVLWMNAASATIYRYSEDKEMTEEDGETGEGFSVDVCRQWENTFEQVKAPGIRKVILRISMVLGKHGGVLPVMRKLVRSGAGGKMGSGSQYISWIHEQDFVNILEWIIQQEKLSGPFNIAAPAPVRNSEFMHQMRSILGRPFGLPSPAWLLELGAFFIRTETELILKSRRVVPRRLLDSGFQFKFADSEQALADLLR